MRKDFTQFTRRTQHPKLGWLVRQCKEAGLRVYIPRSVRSFHGPISCVHTEDYAAALAVLLPVDDIDDDDPMFGKPSGNQARLLRVAALHEADRCLAKAKARSISLPRTRGAIHEAQTLIDDALAHSERGA